KRQTIKENKDQIRVVRESSNEPFALSFAQLRLWLLNQIDGGSAHYNLPSALRLTGCLDRQALQRTFDVIVERHEILRTTYVAGGDDAIQVINPATPLPIAFTDLSGRELSWQQETVRRLGEVEAGTVFDLSRDLLLRVHLLKLGEEDHIIFVTMHHIASDGWSMGVLVNEFSLLYAAFVKGESHSLLPLPIQYADYAHWQRNWLQGDVLEQQLAYWTGQLADLPLVHSLPLDYPRP